ncbi:hypothetical protein [Lacipirellula sp.]|uniref:hypothetical protein n=1 Tax=Lacipirellula sp. TaxID=2691419 RepID=UPI003D137F26
MTTPSRPGGANADGPKPLEITGDAKPAVPAFSCIIYVCKTADGSMSGRVANLAGGEAGEIAASGSSERDVLFKLTREFKSRVSKMHDEQQVMPWIDPPPPPLENEQIRHVPVHL